MNITRNSIAEEFVRNIRRNDADIYDLSIVLVNSKDGIKFGTRTKIYFYQLIYEIHKYVNKYKHTNFTVYQSTTNDYEIILSLIESNSCPILTDEITLSPEIIKEIHYGENKTGGR